MWPAQGHEVYMSIHSAYWVFDSVGGLRIQKLIKIHSASQAIYNSLGVIEK